MNDLYKAKNILLNTEQGKEVIQSLGKMGRKYNCSITEDSSCDVEVLKDILTEKEKNVLKILRYPEQFGDNAIPVMEQNEIRNLIDKMDEYIEHEGKIRHAFGSFDEVYMMELFSVKDILKNMIE